MTLTEVLVVIVVLVIFFSMLDFGVPVNVKRKAQRIQCLSNLKGIGFAYLIWASDNGDKYPMEVSVTNGGMMELTADGGNTWLNFLVMSNELSTPKIFICPADTTHVSATNFGVNFTAQNVSYFVGLDADTNHSQAFLSGDDNFAIGGVPVKSGLLKLSTNTPIAWTAARHKFVGNIGLADGSVWQTDDKQLIQKLIETSLATKRLAIP